MLSKQKSGCGMICPNLWETGDVRLNELTVKHEIVPFSYVQTIKSFLNFLFFLDIISLCKNSVQIF